jgi:hypothetical protein
MKDWEYFNTIMGTEGLGLPKSLSTYQSQLDRFIVVAWNTHVKTWKLLFQQQFVKRLKALDPKRIQIPISGIITTAVPKKAHFFSNCWLQINKLIRSGEIKDSDVRFKDKWFMTYYVLIPKRPEAEQYQQDIYAKLNNLGITSGYTWFGVENTWNRKKLRVKLRLETSLKIPEKLLFTISQAYAKTQKPT